MKKPSFLAFDLGAGSGRAIAGSLVRGRLALTEIHRFGNPMEKWSGALRWNLPRLLSDIRTALRRCAGRVPLLSAAVDTWGVDFGLLDGQGRLLGLPVTYRDRRTEGMPEKFFRIVPREEVFRLTGIQTLPFNTLFQLFSLAKARSPLLKKAASLLFMADLVHYRLTGVKKSEFTLATTSQLYNPRKQAWEKSLFRAMRVTEKLMQDIILPGETVGRIDGALPVIACGSHDTASAVAAVPARGRDWAYISCGTWSLMGVESERPLINGKSFRHNFTNEGGVEGTFRVLKNITGLWLIQRLKPKALSYEKLAAQAREAPPFRRFIDPDAPEFINPPDMAEAIRRYCRKTGQSQPVSMGETARCCLESLALRYRGTLEEIREIHCRPINRIHVIGGGAKNRLLCQFAANACGLPVLAGPVEATAMGNLMVQAMAAGFVSSLEEMRTVIRKSCEPAVYEPENREAWDAAYERFKRICP